MKTYLSADIFKEYRNVRQAVSTKSLGTMKKEDGTVHHANLLKFIKKISASSIAISMKQTHSGNVEIVENSRLLVLPNTDALVTNKTGLALTVLIADCLPIFFYDPIAKVIGVAHAGSKGLLKNVIKNTIDVFINHYQSNPNNIIVSIGPGIESKCYEVEKEYAFQFASAFPMFTHIFIQQEEHYYLDLTSIAVQCLKKEGILNEHIETMDICTKCNSDLYSYREGDKHDRIAGVICLDK